MKKWAIGKPDKKISERLAASAEISQLCADVLVSRGYETNAQAAAFIIPDEPSSPFLIADMKKAADTVNGAIESEQKICVYGDYDCDGIAATAMLYTYLQCMGADVMTYIPERGEGYGMNADSIRRLCEEGVELIITVDNGIAAIAEAELIYELGMRLVVTDHHQPLEKLPHAEAVVDLHRTDCPSVFKDLCGAGVVLKFIAALDDSEDIGAVFEQFGDLAALATVADVVKLCGENRYIVSEGLRLLENTENLGLCALFEEAGINGKITETTLGFMLAPRINAAGRFGSPRIALNLLTTDDEEEAASLAAELTSLNEQRKQCEAEIIAEIDARITKNPSLLCEPVLFFAGKEWYHGVIGIICSRMCQRYGKPCYILTIEGDTARGSARAFTGYSVFASLSHCSGLFINFGGHDGAGGYTVATNDIPKLHGMLIEYAEEAHGNAMPCPELCAEKILEKNDFSVEAIEGLSILAPYGEGNREPLFCIPEAKITKIMPLSDGKHSKFIIRYAGQNVGVVLFGVSPAQSGIEVGDSVDFMVTLDISEWNNRKLISLKVKDYRLSGVEQQKYFAAANAYENFTRGKELPAAYYARIAPQRAELEAVYRAIADDMTLDGIFMRLKQSSASMNYCKFRLCLDIFIETGLVSLNPCSNTCVKLPAKKKVDINSSKLLVSLRGKVGATAV